MTPGCWTPTGWGAQHQVVTTDAVWTVLACHQPGQRVPTDLINPDAAEQRRCARCQVGPQPAPVVGVRRQSPGGAVVVCEPTWDGRQPCSPTDRVWRVVESPTGDPGVGCWLDGWDVAGWQVVA